MGGVRPERGMRPQARDPQHPNLFGSIWTLVGLPPEHPRLLGYRNAGSRVQSGYFLQAWGNGERRSWELVGSHSMGGVNEEAFG